MQTEGGWINISEAARLYGKDRKWVYDQIKQYGLGTKKVGNRRLVQLVELIKQENQFLHQPIDELKADQAGRQARETQWESERARLQGIIERQTYALPKPQSERVFSRFIQWVQSL